MNGFRVVDISELPEEKKDETIRGLYSMYAIDIPIFEQWKKVTLEKNKIICVTKGDNVLGAATLDVGKEVTLNELWAKPSREFVKAYGCTVGRFIYDHAKIFAKRQGKPFFTTGCVGSGIRFKKRTEGKLRINPRPRRARR